MFRIFNFLNKKRRNAISKSISEKSQERNVIKCSNENGILKYEIVEDISMIDYLKYANKCGLGNTKLDVLLINRGNTYFDSIVLRQIIYFYQNDNKSYYVTDSHSKLKIIESVIGNEYIEEIILEMDKGTCTFRVVKSIHKFSLDTIECKSYPCYGENMEPFTLDRLVAFDLVKSLIKRVGEIHELDKIANVYDLYKYTNILDEEYFHPMISDEVITISKMFVKDTYDVRESRDEYFDIILNDTREKIGELTFTLYEDNFMYPDNTVRYEGNVSYSIIPRYQSNHYATRALKLLVKLIKENKSNTDKNLYVSTLPDNINSQKVAINNGAILYYEGEVPEKEMLNYHDGVKAVKIYKITI